MTAFQDDHAALFEGLLAARLAYEEQRSAFLGVAFVLTCAECGKRSDEEEGLGWRGLLALEEDGSESVEVFCPECHRDEFGDGS
jgi:hypothetical protein